MTAEDLLAADRSVRVKFARQRSWRRSAGAFLILFALASAFAAPAAAATPPGGTLSSTDAMLKWINAYRGKPEPDALPVLVRGLSEMQAFKDPESCGAYIGFIAGVLGANPERANALIEKMLTIQPADHWVLVRAIAYSGLPNWKVLLLKYTDRMRTRRGMIDKYVSGKLPTLDQIAYQNTKPGMLDKVKVAFSFGVVPKKAVALDPTPELIGVLEGYYLATGSHQPIDRIIRLLPLANDKDNVDSLTTGSAAKFTLASNAVRDLHLLAILKRAAPGQPEETAKILNDVIETAETVDTVAHAQGIARRHRGTQAKRAELQARDDHLGPSRPGRAVDGLRRRRRHRPNRDRHSLRDWRRCLLGRSAIHVALDEVRPRQLSLHGAVTCCMSRQLAAYVHLAADFAKPRSCSSTAASAFSGSTQANSGS